MKSGDRDSDYRLVHQISCFAVQAEQPGAVGTGTGLPVPSRAVLKAMDGLTVRCFAKAPPQFVLETVKLVDGSAEDTHVAEALEWSRFRLRRDRS